MSGRNLLTSALLAVILGCSASQSSPARPQDSSDLSASANPATGGLDLASFQLDGAQLYRDGGTIKITGRTAAVKDVAIRYDGRMGSETRGDFYVTPGAGAAERPLTKAEAAALQPRIEQAIPKAETDVDRNVLQQAVDHLKTFQAKK